jgi:hypothetical protein
MVVSSLTALALQWKTVARSFRLFARKDEGGEHADIDAAMARIEVPNRWLVIGLIPITIGLMVVLGIAFDMNLLLALVACRATGETDTTPIGAMGKVTQLMYAGLATQNATINLMAAGTTSGAAGSAADLLTDLKSGYLLNIEPQATTFSYRLRRDKLRQVHRREGRYLLRTNLTDTDPAQLWNHYLQLVQVEEAFKNLKGDLAIRPIYHQRQDRIEAHIFVAFLAYCCKSHWPTNSAPRPPASPPAAPKVCRGADDRRPHPNH